MRVQHGRRAVAEASADAALYVHVHVVAVDCAVAASPLHVHHGRRSRSPAAESRARLTTQVLRPSNSKQNMTGDGPSPALAQSEPGVMPGGCEMSHVV